MLPPAGGWCGWHGAMTGLGFPSGWLALLLAPIIGSFLGVLILRLPAGEPVAFDRSRCRACGQVLGIRDLVPLLSWSLARGRCRHCGARVGGFYPAIELAALGVAAWAALVTSGPALWASCILGWTLLALAWIDVRHLILPDALTLPLLGTGLAAAALLDPGGIADHAIGAAAGYAAFRLVAVTYRAVRGRDGLGAGDAKLLAAAGAWVSWQGLPGVVLIAAATGLVGVLAAAAIGVALEPARRVPFGPFLCLGLWLIWLYGPLTFG